MATAIKKCRVCGKEYEACRTARHIAGVFRWQEVACSPECGSIYLARIEESRRTAEDAPLKKEDIKAVEDTEIIDITDEDEDEDFDDELDEYFDGAE